MSARIRTLIVGAGTAGVPLASRLGEDPSREVVVLEAGSCHVKAAPGLLDGGTLHAAAPGHPANWVYESELFPGKPHLITRGRALGGSTAINGGYFVRATPADFSRWAEIAGPEWSYERALPILQALEHDLDHCTEADGNPGPMQIVRPPQSGTVTAAFLAAALELGFAEELDKNAGGVPGVGPVPSNIVDGTRINTGMAYLSAASTVDIRGETRALRVVLDGNQAVGIETSSGFVPADEVVLSAGAIATPHLLMLSGIGPQSHLEEHGIEVVSDLPVGAGFSDHPNLAVEWLARRPLIDWGAGFSFPTALNFDSARTDDSLPAHPEGDLEILLAAKPLGFLLNGQCDDRERLQFLVALQHHSGRGRLSLRSPEPCAQPRIEYRYFENAEDLRRMRIGVRTAVGLLHTRAFSGLFAGFAELDDGVLADDAMLDEWIRAHLGTALHTCGTAPMGPVVDGSGRVHGVQGLRVADTSILPTAPHRGPAATAVFIGEFIARRMRDGQ